MRFTSTATTVAATLLASALSAQAYIQDMRPPQGVFAAGDKVSVVFNTTNSLTNNEQYMILFSLSTNPVLTQPNSTALGQPVFGFTDLVASGQSINGIEQNHTITVDVVLPESLGDNLVPQNATEQQPGRATLAAWVAGTIGASGGITQQIFRQDIFLKQ